MSEEVNSSTPESVKANKPFLNEKTQALLGSWGRVFIGTLVGVILASGTAPWTWQGEEALNFIWSAASATLVVIYNYLNPKDVRYGVGSEEGTAE